VLERALGPLARIARRRGVERKLERRYLQRSVSGTSSICVLDDGGTSAAAVFETQPMRY
jgi:hypothetical protein